MDDITDRDLENGYRVYQAGIAGTVSLCRARIDVLCIHGCLEFNKLFLFENCSVCSL